MSQQDRSDADVDGSEESGRRLGMSRREVIGALVSAGILGASASAGSGGGGSASKTSLGIGGGNMASNVSQYEVKHHKGTKAERPSPGVKDRVWEVYDPGGPDHGAVYHDDGSSWNLIDRKVGSLTATTVNNVYYAANFDGADGGEKIQNALDHADSQPGKNRVVVGPIGPDSPSSAPESDVWEVSTPIDPPSNVQLVGEGYPLLYLSDDASDDIIRTASDDSGQTTTNVHIEGLRINGNKSNHSTWKKGNSNFGTDPSGGTRTIKGLAGIRAVDVQGWVISDCEIHSCARFGICIKLSHDVVVRDVETYDCDDDGLTTTNQFFQSTDLSNILFENVYSHDNKDQGLEIEDGSQDVTIRDSKIESNSNTGITLKSHNASEPEGNDEKPCNDITIDNCRIEGNTNSGLLIRGAPTDITKDLTISDCHFEGNSGGAVEFGGDGQKTIKDVSFDNTHVHLDGGANAVHLGTNTPIENVDIDLTVRIGDASAVTNVIDLRKARIDGVSISLKSTDSGPTRGIYIRSEDDAVKNVIIRDDTIIKNCDESAIWIQKMSNPLEGGYIGGVLMNNGQDTSASDGHRSGLYMVNGVTDFLVSLRATDDQDTKTQVYGINPGGDYNIFDGCNIRGNKNDGFAPGIGTNTVQGDNIT